MCPSYNRKGFEVLTTQGQEKPDSQSATINYEKVNDLKKINSFKSKYFVIFSPFF